MKQSKHKLGRICGTTSSGFQNGFVLIETSWCTKGTIPCNRRISYMGGKRTIVPEMFWTQHVENVFLEVLEWKAEVWNLRKLKHPDTEKIQKTFQCDLSYPEQQNEAPVMSEFSEEREIHMKAFGQWLGKEPNWAHTDLHKSFSCLPLIHQSWIKSSLQSLFSGVDLYLFPSALFQGNTSLWCDFPFLNTGKSLWPPALPFAFYQMEGDVSVCVRSITSYRPSSPGTRRGQISFPKP